jgi:hypothetical protein
VMIVLLKIKNPSPETIQESGLGKKESQVD